ncbi:hypothetical protein [Neptuniibacter sp. QD37_11]|uniref:hypothetical protein n=1 Tax=Neptuniibacter sp. QD37_11 TaxID=3398209 RepID=UPI0039F6217B
MPLNKDDALWVTLRNQWITHPLLGEGVSIRFMNTGFEFSDGSFQKPDEFWQERESPEWSEGWLIASNYDPDSTGHVRYFRGPDDYIERYVINGVVLPLTRSAQSDSVDLHPDLRRSVEEAINLGIISSPMKNKRFPATLDSEFIEWFFQCEIVRDKEALEYILTTPGIKDIV